MAIINKRGAKYKYGKGARFGILTFTGRRKKAETSGGFTKTLWSMRCDCGKQKWIPQASLSSGNTKSCGCARTALKAATIAVKASAKAPKSSGFSCPHCGESLFIRTKVKKSSRS